MFIDLDKIIGSPVDDNPHVDLAINPILESAKTFQQQGNYKITANDGIYRLKFQFNSLSGLTENHQIKCGFLDEIDIYFDNGMNSGDDSGIEIKDINVTGAGVILNELGVIYNETFTGGVTVNSTSQYNGNGIQIAFTKNTLTGDFDLFINFKKKSSSVTSGIYKPVLSAVSNVDTVTKNSDFTFQKIGNTVNVSGSVLVDVTALNFFTFEISLPVPSNFSDQFDCFGSAGVSEGNVIENPLNLIYGGMVYSNLNNNIEITCQALVPFATSLYLVNFICTYKIK